METLTILTTEETDILLNWCKQQKLEKEQFNRRETCRLKKWWGVEVDFTFKTQRLIECEPITNDLYLADLHKRFCPNADSILLYYYESGGGIGEHNDKECFQAEVILINLVDDSPDLFGNRPATKFRWQRQNYYLQHGEVVKFDSRVLHSVPKLKSARYSLQFRQLI